MNLNWQHSQWGWQLFFEQQLQESDQALSVARVLGQERDLYKLILSDDSVISAQVSGRFRHEHEGSWGAFPAVGDWVLCSGEAHQERALIHKVLDRRTSFYRKDPAKGVQVVATNIDTVFVVTSMNRDLNFKRLDRYLSMVWDSGASPVVVLSKQDLVENPEEVLQELAERYPGVPVHGVSVLGASTCEVLKTYLQPGKTVVLLGSSGVGKSTLTNFFMGNEVAATQNVREDDDRGRHTTTSRSLYRLAEGALLMDTPGMRQLALVDQEDGVQELFDDIIQLQQSCKFRDCSHHSEPGCAVQAALDEGVIEADRWDSFLKLQREVSYQDRREDKQKMAEEKKKWKKVTQNMRARMKDKGRE